MSTVSGRTGRAGKSGRAVTFVAPKDFTKLREIQHYAKIQIPRMPIPTQSMWRKHGRERCLKKFARRLRQEEWSPYVRIIEQESEGELSTVDIAAALLKTADGAGQ